jgi:DNA helicase-2/ATP-dependent DNA helicase PcrA
MAVLYRAHFQSMDVQMQLTHDRIPFAITSGLRFFEQAHVKDVCSPLRLLHNPTDELAFVRLLGLLPRVGERTARRVFNDVGRRFRPGAAADAARVRERLPAAARADWDRMSAAFDVGEQRPERLAGEVVGAFAKAFYETYAAEAYENYERRLEDVDELVRYTARFASLADFLNEVALLTNVDTGGERSAGEPEDSVLLSTIHQAKGLEWKAVFVLWLADGLFPSGRAMDADDSGDASEERRLFYVASTRAKDTLYLCYPKMRRARDGSMTYYSPSRFLTEIPPPLLARERVGSYV